MPALGSAVHALQFVQLQKAKQANTHTTSKTPQTHPHTNNKPPPRTHKQTTQNTNQRHPRASPGPSILANGQVLVPTTAANENGQRAARSVRSARASIEATRSELGQLPVACVQLPTSLNENGRASAPSPTKRPYFCGAAPAAARSETRKLHGPRRSSSAVRDRYS